MSSGKRKRSVDDLVPKDRISELPDDILYHVMSYLKLPEAVHASLLSKRYRYNYLYHTRPRFREQFHNAIREDMRHKYEDILVRGVNQFIQSYKGGTRLNAFDVSFCLHGDFTNDIDQWVRFAVSKNVEQLSLDLNSAKCISHINLNRWRSGYIFPTELLYQGHVPKLRYLYLKSCILGSGFMGQINSLKSIMFSSVHVGHVESLFSSCLNLESLSLYSCDLPAKLLVTGSLHLLKFLTVYECRGLQEIELSGAKVTSFEYVGYLNKFSFSALSNLEKVYFCSKGVRALEYAFSKLVEDLPTMKSLVFNTSVKNWAQYLPDRITAFKKVTELSIYCVDVTFDASKIILILKACPNLENLQIMIATITFRENVQGMCKTDLTHLKEIHIGGFYFHESCIDFTTYMLDNVVSLERMVIDPEEKFYIGINREQCGNRITWDEGERQAVCERLQDYYSKSAQIIIL